MGYHPKGLEMVASKKLFFSNQVTKLKKSAVVGMAAMASMAGMSGMVGCEDPDINNGNQTTQPTPVKEFDYKFKITDILGLGYTGFMVYMDNIRKMNEGNISCDVNVSMDENSSTFKNNQPVMIKKYNDLYGFGKLITNDSSRWTNVSLTAKFEIQPNYNFRVTVYPDDIRKERAEFLESHNVDQETYNKDMQFIEDWLQQIKKWCESRDVQINIIGNENPNPTIPTNPTNPVAKEFNYTVEMYETNDGGKYGGFEMACTDVFDYIEEMRKVNEGHLRFNISFTMSTEATEYRRNYPLSLTSRYNANNFADILTLTSDMKISSDRIYNCSTKVSFLPQPGYDWGIGIEYEKIRNGLDESSRQTFDTNFQKMKKWCAENNMPFNELGANNMWEKRLGYLPITKVDETTGVLNAYVPIDAESPIVSMSILIKYNYDIYPNLRDKFYAYANFVVYKNSNMYKEKRPFVMPNNNSLATFINIINGNYYKDVGAIGYPVWLKTHIPTKVVFRLPNQSDVLQIEINLDSFSKDILDYAAFYGKYHNKNDAILRANQDLQKVRDNLQKLKECEIPNNVKLIEVGTLSKNIDDTFFSSLLKTRAVVPQELYEGRGPR